MKKLLIKFIAIVYLFVVSIPLTILVYLLYYFISIILYFKKTKKNEKRVSSIPNEWFFEVAGWVKFGKSNNKFLSISIQEKNPFQNEQDKTI